MAVYGLMATVRKHNKRMTTEERIEKLEARFKQLEKWQATISTSHDIYFPKRFTDIMEELAKLTKRVEKLEKGH